MQDYAEIIERLITALGKVGINTGIAAWNIAVRGVRAEGLAILILALIAGLLVLASVKGLFRALPEYAGYVEVVRSLTGLIVAGTIFHAKDALVMVIAPDYFILKAGATSALTKASAMPVLPVASYHPVYPFLFIGLSVLMVVAVSLRRKKAA